MSLQDTVRWVVCYDIRDADRGLRVLRFMKGHGVPLQYSVFVVEASAARLQGILSELETLIAPAVDDVRAYRWPERAEAHELGCPLVPEGIVIRSPASAPATVRRVAKARRPVAQAD
ncbi:MAG: hypothetical protein RL654_893 [Pseudomonadota bacterium]|jgi:CRISPR-associated protein Cas2